ncbi:MAG: class I SAM-dependent methyltransferase [Thiolinea sp.]
MLIKNFSEYDFLERYALLENNARILNAGSSSVRYGNNCVNIDVQEKLGVDVVCDVHSLPESLGKFDAIICNGMLQYCQTPNLVAQQFHQVLKKDGYLFVDAPWVQPFCQDETIPDRYRYSAIALRGIFSNFDIVECAPSIRPGSAFYLLGRHIADNMTRNKYINTLLNQIAGLFLYPFRAIRTVNEHKTAGAFYLIGQKTE